MKAFNLEAALAGAKVVTRDGREVKIAGYNEKAAFREALVGWLEKEVMWWDKEGKYPGEDMLHFDLFMAPTERKEFVIRVVNPTNYKDSYVAGPFKNLSDAEMVFNSRREGWASIHEITIIE
jgi:hypothetical protein